MRRCGSATAGRQEGRIGPNTLSANAWLPKVWGGKAPKFKDLAEMNHFIALVMGLHNDLALIFDGAPTQFRPTFYESKVEGRRVQIVDEWCVGFLKGMRLDAAGWKPLKRERPELLKPIELFGSKAGWRELKAGGDEAMHRRWAPKITPAVRAIGSRTGSCSTGNFRVSRCTESWASGSAPFLARSFLIGRRV